MEASRACQLVSFPSPCFFQGLTGLEVATIHPTNIYCIRERERERGEQMRPWPQELVILRGSLQVPLPLDEAFSCQTVAENPSSRH